MIMALKINQSVSRNNESEKVESEAGIAGVTHHGGRHRQHRENNNGAQQNALARQHVRGENQRRAKIGNGWHH